MTLYNGPGMPCRLFFWAEPSLYVHLGRYMSVARIMAVHTSRVVFSYSLTPGKEQKSTILAG